MTNVRTSRSVLGFSRPYPAEPDRPGYVERDDGQDEDAELVPSGYVSPERRAW